MVIVFDSGPVTRDRMFKAAGSRAVLEQSAEGLLRVVVPRVVLKEAVRATRGRLEEADKALRHARDKLNEAFDEPPEVEPLDVDSLVDRYERELETKLAANRVEVIGWDLVTHDELVDRDLARKPPFDESGRGYRDALTWHVIRDLVLNDGETRVLFVTRDKDFSDDADESTLHPALLEEIGGDLTVVTIVKDLADAMRVIGDVRTDFISQLTTTIEHQANDLGMRALWVLDQQGVLPSGLQTTVAGAWIRSPEVTNVYEVWGLWSARVRALLEVDFRGIVVKGELDSFWNSVERSGFRVDRSDWNYERDSLHVEGGGVSRVELDVVYDPSEDSLELEYALESADGAVNGHASG